MSNHVGNETVEFANSYYPTRGEDIHRATIPSGCPNHHFSGPEESIPVPHPATHCLGLPPWSAPLLGRIETWSCRSRDATKPPILSSISVRSDTWRISSGVIKYRHTIAHSSQSSVQPRTRSERLSKVLVGPPIPNAVQTPPHENTAWLQNVQNPTCTL